eukprot:TRINITY_DN2732_c0_g2_i4.p1 TRINITY_DN2732_c0_g2~~TRINITY_DN2732_c0_g2_i4.p1  ORF type:complete len:503 (+),score=131.20 TRINITY_DN2732_c0_g2_i4:149-1657(+)
MCIRDRKGSAAQYITRNQSIKKLQVSLPDFRRLCILKGVYPREPGKKVHGKDKVYYYAKDILWLSHERVLSTFRDLKAFLKKFKKAVAKGDISGARKLEEFKPRYSLNHIVRERYPTFTDALRDLDDALCLVQLFSTMPSDDKLLRSRVENCQKLVQEFQCLVMNTSALNKVFLSVKGVYHQAEVMGQVVTWVTPYKFTPTVDSDVDIKVMLTFLEFYEVLLHFVNCKLYHEEGLVYPPNLAPVFNPNTKDGAGLAALKRLERKDQAMDADDYALTVDSTKHIFKDCVFYLGREVPTESLLFVITNFGGQAYWGDHPQLNYENSAKITHHVVDRPKLLGTAVENRDYVQPQWVFDCANNKMLLPTFEYSIGRALPPHLSPFVDDDAEGYIPQRKEYLQRLKGIDAPDHGEGAVVQVEEDGDHVSDDEEVEAGVVKAFKVQKSSAEQDQAELARSLLSRKKRNLYQHIRKVEDAKKENVSTLKKKRKAEQNPTNKRPRSERRK